MEVHLRPQNMNMRLEDIVPRQAPMEDIILTLIHLVLMAHRLQDTAPHLQDIPTIPHQLATRLQDILGTLDELCTVIPCMKVIPEAIICNTLEIARNLRHFRGDEVLMDLVRPRNSDTVLCHALKAQKRALNSRLHL